MTHEVTKVRGKKKPKVIRKKLSTEEGLRCWVMKKKNKTKQNKTKTNLRLYI